jgi:hypothetical protein
MAELCLDQQRYLAAPQAIGYRSLLAALAIKSGRMTPSAP